MFDLQISILGLTILANLFLGGITFVKNFRDKSNFLFGSFVVSVIIWTFSMLLFKIITKEATALLWLRLSYIAAGFIGINFFAFTISFVKEKIHKIIWLFLTLMTILMSLIILQPWFLITKISISQNIKTVIIDYPHYLIYIFYFCIFFFGSLLIIYRKYRLEKGMEKARLAYILWGILIAGILGTFFNLILPGFNNWHFTWLGPVFSLIFVLFITFAITKYHFLNIKVIAVEIFTIVILILTGIQIFISDNLPEFLLNATIFLLLLIFGIFLIKSVLEEVRRREQVQQLAAELETANEKLKELDEIKSDFISIASHQLRTPLTTIKGLVSMVLEGTWRKQKNKEKEELEKVYFSAQRLINLVETLLNISRIESGRMIYNFELSSLEEIVESVVNELAILTKLKRIKISFEKPDQPLPKINIDALAIRQVIMNFLDNAIHYTSKGTIVVKLSLHSGIPLTAGEKNKDEIIFSVTDTGAGLSADQKESLFQKFSRAGSGVKEGFGLGLYAAAEIIKAHNGKIGAESEGKEKGSTFWFSLPIK